MIGWDWSCWATSRGANSARRCLPHWREADARPGRLASPQPAIYLPYNGRSGQLTVPVVKIQRLRGALPRYQSEDAAGIDLLAVLDEPLMLEPFARAAVPTGIAVEIPAGFEGQVRPRSGRALEEGLTLVNSPGTIDADYRGELKVLLINLGQQSVTIKPQERIAQL